MKRTLQALETSTRASACAWYDLFFGEIYRDVRCELAGEDDEERRTTALDRLVRLHIAPSQSDEYFFGPPSKRGPCSRGWSAAAADLHARLVWTRTIHVLLANMDVIPHPEEVSRLTPASEASDIRALARRAAEMIIRAQIESLLKSYPVEVCNDDH